MQHALYLAMAESVLKRKVDRKAVVKQAGYYFPTGRGQGERIVRTREQLAGAGEVMGHLCQIVANGAFLATNDPEEDCGYCDYQADLPRPGRRPRLPASSSWTTAGTKP